MFPSKRFGIFSQFFEHSDAWEAVFECISTSLATKHLYAAQKNKKIAMFERKHGDGIWAFNYNFHHGRCFMPKFSKFFKGLGIIFLIILILLICAVLWLTIREYRPEKEEALKVPKNTRTLSLDDSLRIMTYNIGYAGLDKSEDFFMDGGSKVQPDKKEQVEVNLKGIEKVLTENPADVYFLQEVDKDSKRSFHIDETEYLKNALDMEGIFACNFKCDFVPYPLPPIGKVNSGIFTMTDLQVNSAARLALPESFSWPVKTCNLKRCMQETRIPLEGTDVELVLINFHLEAYDDGDGKIAQSKMLAEKLSKEYEAGNYVIAGGDFNQTFEGMDKYPITNTENWVPGIISQDTLPEHFSFAVDDTYPTCRLLNAPYTGSYETSQVYVIDGFIVSDNIKVSDISVINTDFEYTDHQPVQMEISLK